VQQSYVYGNANTNSYSNPDTYGHANSNADSYSYANSDCYSKTYSHSKRAPGAEASSYSAAEAVIP